MSLFKKAVKETVKLRLALTGPSGAGKTMSALRIARGLCGRNARIALIDTENCSASLYAGKILEDAQQWGPIDFDTAQMQAPFLVKKYLDAINMAVEADFDVIIVDSLSHAWAGEGGVLQRKEQLDARGGNSFTNWGKMTPEQNQLVNAVLQSKKHIICTMRSKTEYIVEQNSQGKSAPKKVGTAPIQRDGFEYEFDVCLDVALNHTAQASKDRSGLFDEQTFKITEKTGEMLSAWLKGGGNPPPEAPKVAPQKPTETKTQPPVQKQDSSPKEEPPAPSQDNGKKSIHSFIPSFGLFKGKNIYEVDPNTLEKYCMDISVKTKKPFHPDVQKFLDESIKAIEENRKTP